MLLSRNTVIFTFAFAISACVAGCSGGTTSPADGRPAEGPTADGPREGPAAQPGTPDAGSDATVADLEADLSAFCELDRGPASKAVNPDLTVALPGTEWQASKACLSRMPYLRFSGNQDLDSESETFKFGAVTGKARASLKFSKGATMTLAMDLEYHAKLDLMLNVFSNGATCAQARNRFLGIKNNPGDLNEGPIQDGIDAAATTCVQNGSNRCICDVAINLHTTKRQNTGYLILEGNWGIKLASNEEMRFLIEGASMSIDLLEDKAPGRTSIPLISAVMNRR